ncbi:MULTISPECIES: pyridoxamine 5'-phosphate oxidase family protein [Prevotella]|uniref:Pyridoxamine 5'-phosphate oxidase n=1 Tax=Prevotella herbatica TaxID=2801997 RepID=A0ABN6EMN3_9BACT|nr:MULTISPECIES: pyridoxamine 5'-phosphate oxidase family protein [Prevotella]MDN5554244.1 pyridoxamine 5'-phosphate oxidase family protein [Prevotella sp.]BCS85991.1 pyridoxamine 5'-phosphate oxidase [Prevotella herbatica]
MRNFEQTVENMVEKSTNTFICYIDEDGCPVTKAMLKPREHEGVRIFYFTTNTSSNKVKCFKQNNRASIYFVNPQFFRGASLTGTMEVLETAEAKERIWQKGDEIYYPKGVTDPDYCVLKFTATKGRFYNDFHSDDFDINQ